MSAMRVVSLSGGTTSWAAGKRVVERYGKENVVLLFADVKGQDDNPFAGEDEDTYRFLEAGAENIGLPVTRIEEGRSVWQVFHDVAYIGNTQVDPCSHRLKRELIKAWLKEHCDPETTVLYQGLDSSEGDRIKTNHLRWTPWPCDYPLTWKPDMWKPDAIAWAKREVGFVPELTELGFPHSNCGGACVKAGQGQWKRLLEIRPARYAYWEENEERFRREKDKDVAVLRDRRGGTTTPLTLKAFRERIEANPQCSLFDEGNACKCM